MGQNRLELHPVQLIEQPGGHHQDGMTRASTHAQRIDARIGHHVQGRLGDPGVGTQPLDQVEQPGLGNHIGGLGGQVPQGQRFAAPPGQRRHPGAGDHEHRGGGRPPGHDQRRQAEDDADDDRAPGDQADGPALVVGNSLRESGVGTSHAGAAIKSPNIGEMELILGSPASWGGAPRVLTSPQGCPRKCRNSTRGRLNPFGRLGQMIETVLGPLAALAAMLVAISFGFRGLRRRPVPVRAPVPARSRRDRRG